MNQKSLERLRLDRRLVGRRGWIAPEELERALEALPDVSHKAQTEAPEAEREREAEPSGEAPTGP